MERHERIKMWQEAKKERERIKGLKHKALGFLMNQQYNFLVELSNKDPEYKELLTYADEIIKGNPKWLETIEQ